MKAFLKSVVAWLLALLLMVPVAFAQDRRAFTQEELDQMLAPIALYPDPLLTQILMAATYPLEVVQAARWSRANPLLKGQEAVRAVEPMDWDPSVKSLVAFPQILHRMDEQLDWTQRLGEAFLEQEPHVMDAIQGLRQRAATAGTLRSDDRMRVLRQDGHILVEPAQPQVVYVPYYDPAVVYGPWWWPGYPPVYWGPPAGYYVGPGYWPGFFWSSGIVIGTGFFFGHFSWPHRHVIVVNKHVTNVVVNRQGTVIHRAPVAPDHRPVRWQHDPHHRKGVPFRHSAMRDDFRRLGPSGGDARRDHHRSDAAPLAGHRDGERPAGFQAGRVDGRRDSPAIREGRVTAPNRDATQGSGKPADGRGRATFSPDARESRPVRPMAHGNDRRLETARNTTRAQSHSMPAHPAPMAPVARPEARHVVANPNGNGRQRAVPEQRARQPEARAFSDRGHAGQPATTTRPSAPASRPSAGSGNPPPRMGGGTHRGDGGAFRQRGGARGQNRFSAR